jgi:hypothetical protein
MDCLVTDGIRTSFFFNLPNCKFPKSHLHSRIDQHFLDPPKIILIYFTRSLIQQLLITFALYHQIRSRRLCVLVQAPRWTRNEARTFRIEDFKRKCNFIA